MDPDLALLPDGYRLVGKIKLPISWRRYDRCAARIRKEHPGVRSFLAFRLINIVVIAEKCDCVIDVTLKGLSFGDLG